MIHSMHSGWVGWAWAAAGVCGLARLSKRGLVNVSCFMGSGFLTSTAVSYARGLREAPSEYDERWGTAQATAGWNYVMAILAVALLAWDAPKKWAPGARGLNLAAAACGALFTVGLIVSRMTVQQKVMMVLFRCGYLTVV
jgi:hypothetical protein